MTLPQLPTNDEAIYIGVITPFITIGPVSLRGLLYVQFWLVLVLQNISFRGNKSCCSPLVFGDV